MPGGDPRRFSPHALASGLAAPFALIRPTKAIETPAAAVRHRARDGGRNNEMKRMMIYAMVGVCTMGVGVAAAQAAELTNQGTTTTDEAKMPSTAEFANGPAGGGATLGSKDHIPTGSEFANGPIGGAQTDPNERRMPSAGEFSNGPSGISK